MYLRILRYFLAVADERNITRAAGYYGTISLEAQGGTLDIAAFGGPLGIRRDMDARVTRWGGLSCFATFLKASRMFDRLVENAPFIYASPNAPKVSDVVGAMVLAILAGFRRYRHIERIV